MTKKKKRPAVARLLCEQAEAKAEADKLQAQMRLSPDRTPQAFHEPRVRQVELQMQNEHLRRTQSELKSSEERFRALFDLGPVAIYSCDSQGIIQEFNRRAVELWGREPKLGDGEERFCGSFKAYRPDGTILPQEQCPMADVLTGASPSVNDAEVLVERPDGSRITVAVNVVPMKDDRGKITGAINCFHDITGRKRFENALEQAKEEADRLKAQIEVETAERKKVNQALMVGAVRNHELKDEADILKRQMEAEIGQRKEAQERAYASLQRLRDLQAAIDQHSILTITDSQGRITYANDRFCALSKFTPEELLGQDHRIVSSGFHSKEFIRDLWTTIGNGKVWKGEIKDRAKDGSFYWMEATIAPCLNSEGKPFQYVAIRTDITARKAIEVDLLESKNAAEHANRAKDEFIAALSHELRTPLTPILLIATSLEADGGLEPSLHGQIEMIRQNAELEVHLIDDLLDITKIVHGKISLRPEAIDVHQFLLKALEIVSVDLSQKRIKVDAHTDAHHSRANGDPIRIQQVFWNVIKNAAKFTPEDGSIYIRTFNSDDRTLNVEIRDTGMGISPENLASVFRPFEQGAASGIQRFGGLGLGMTISKAIVELHGGGISATSEGAGHGATFTIRLPVSDAAAAGQPLPNVLRVEGSTTPLHILLVEDHEHTRMILERLLSRAGHQVEAVGSCREACKAAKAAGKKGACPFQAIISDLGLPDGSGLDLVREIKAQFPEINAVAVSGYGTDQDIRKSAEAGFNHHLVKPLGMESLRRALAA